MKNPTMAEMIAKTYDDIQDEKLKEMKMIEKALRISLGMGRYKKKRGK